MLCACIILQVLAYCVIVCSSIFFALFPIENIARVGFKISIASFIAFLITSIALFFILIQFSAIRDKIENNHMFSWKKDKKNLRTANLSACHPQLQRRMVDPDGLEPPTRRL